MFLHFLFFTCCAHPLSFRVSLFTKRPYVSLYSYFHSVQTCWIWKIYLNTSVKNKKNMLILKFHPGMKCLHVFFPFLHIGMKFHPCLSSRDEISSRQKRLNSKRHFTIDRDDFIPGWNFTCKHAIRSFISAEYTGLFSIAELTSVS